LVHADDRPALEAKVAKLGEGAETVAFETRSQHRDGSFRWVRWTATMQSELRLIHVTGQDISELGILEREVIRIVGHARELLSSELHDGLCQTLAGIAALSATLSRKIGVDSASNVLARATELTELLHQAIAEARDLARGLGPPRLRHTDLSGALEILASDVEHRFGVSCAFRSDLPLPRLPAETEAHVLRVAQEATRNAVIHGEADHVQIILTCTDGEGDLRVRDDGVGLPVGEPCSEGIGLQTMAYRARLIGGFLKLRRRASRGTEIVLVFPLAAAEDC
jgi:signal transduction histidine kinase